MKVKPASHLAWIIAGPLLVLSGSATAADVSCQAKDVVKCRCPASLVVSCPGAQGYIDNEQRASSITLAVRDSDGSIRKFEFESPPEGIRSYYAASFNQWAIQELRQRGAIANEKADIRLESFRVALDAEIYSDPHKREIAGTAGGENASRSGSSNK